MTDATPHALWKAFCRFMEHKAFARRFGDGYGRRFDSFAIFEISDPQKDSMSDTPLHDVAPPFPFPKIVLIFPDFLLALEQPEMDIDAGVLQYDATIYNAREAVSAERREEIDNSRAGDWKMIMNKATAEGSEQVAMAKVRLDVEASEKAGEPIAEVAEFRVQIHYPDEIVDYADDLLFSTRIDENTRRIRSTCNSATIAELELLLEESRRIEGQLRDNLKEHLRICFMLGIFAIDWINRPKHYIVEQSAEITRKPSKADKDRVRRLAERSRHIVVGHDEIRRRWNHCHGTHGSPMPHLRRGHYKTLRSERYKNMRGKVIWVSPCHVGGECVEWREGAVSYKVIG